MSFHSPILTRGIGGGGLFFCLCSFLKRSAVGPEDPQTVLGDT